MRSFSGIVAIGIIAFSAVAALLNILFLTLYPIDPWVLRSFHLSTALTLIFLLYKPRVSAKKLSLFVDSFIAVLVLIPTAYILLNIDGLLGRYGVIPTTWDVIFGSFVIISLLEATRRTVGSALPIIALFFLAYCLFGNHFPGQLWHRGYSFERVVSIMFSGDGIYSTPLGVSATYVIMFILFGSFLQISGGLKYFIDLSLALTGHRRGGPAKVSLLSSALMGTISGSAVGNVVTTGSFTIPLMKRIGYKPRFAAAVEAVSSTGGQIMPPVMGAGAFIMADITGIPYSTIATAAVIPALMYFFTVFWIIDFEAGRLKLRSTEPQGNVLQTLLRGIHLLIPLFVLLFCLIVWEMSPLGAGLWAIGTAVILSWLSTQKENRLGPKNIIRASSEGFKAVAPIAVTCATAGIVIGVFSLTGVGAVLARQITFLANDSTILLLIFAMLLTLILGMGLPTVAAYAIAASTVAPIVISAGIAPLNAHLFVFYYACLSTITPPVALSSFAAAAIAGENAMKVGWTALKLAATAYILPFLFIFGPELLLQGTPLAIATALVSALIGVVFLAAGLQGWIIESLSAPLRVVSTAAGFSFMYSGWGSDVIGIALALFVIIFQIRLRAKHRLETGMSTALQNTPNVSEDNN